MEATYVKVQGAGWEGSSVWPLHTAAAAADSQPHICASFSTQRNESADLLCPCARPLHMDLNNQTSSPCAVNVQILVPCMDFKTQCGAGCWHCHCVEDRGCFLLWLWLILWHQGYPVLQRNKTMVAKPCTLSAAFCPSVLALGALSPLKV